MARRYDPAKVSMAAVSEDTLAGAQQRVDEAREGLRAVEGIDPSAPGWDSEYTAALGSLRGAERRLEALTSLRAAQVERSGKRDAVVKASAGELAGMAKGLAASRDQVAAAAAAHLKALAALSAAVEAHNGNLSAGRSMLAAKGLTVRDDMVDVDSGAEHAEGTLDRGIRCGGTDWTPVPVQGVITHALLETFGRFAGPYAPLRGSWPSYLVESRPDGLVLPSADDVKVVAM